MYKHLARFAVLAVISTPFLASAATAADLQAQAEALLQQVAALQAQLASQGGTVVPSGIVTIGACPQVGTSLRVGSTGDSVTRLQQFLARDPSVYPEGQVTGYFGALTQAAVQRWQAKYNIVSSGTPDTTGYGVVGPRTAAAMSLQCSGSTGGVVGGTGGTVGGTVAPTVGGFIQVSPVSGDAPLSVTVTATVNTANSCGAALYTLDFGDGTSAQTIPVSANACAAFAQTFTHVYLYGGIYIVKLSAGGHETTATVVVSGASAPTPSTPATPPTAASMNVSPTSGTAPLTVHLNINGGNAVYSDGVSLDFGDGTNATLCAGGVPCGQIVVTHRYLTSGSFQASLIGSSGGTDTALVTASVTVQSAASPPAQLSVNVSPSSVKQGSAPLQNGDSLNISWNTSNAPTDAAMQFSLVRTDGTFYGTVSPGSSAVSGSGSWAVPGPQCTSPGTGCVYQTDSKSAYYTDPGTFVIVGKLYTPANGCLGFSMISNCTQATVITSATSSPFTIAAAPVTTYPPFSLAPSVGGNPLAVQVQYSYAQSIGYTLTWGDGQSGTGTCTASTDGSALLSCTANHTYSAGGTYTVTLVRGSQTDTASVTITN